MLFDLRGKRRRVVQVVYSLLAASFVIGFVFFGVGTGGVGSISDLFGGGSGGSTTSAYDDQINAANDQLDRNPKDTQALLKLAKNEWLKARTGFTQDASGQVAVSDDAHTDLGQAADAWTEYLKFNKGKPDHTVAAYMAQDYYYLNDFPGAAKAQRIVVANTSNAGTYSQLAFFEYGSAAIGAGDAAAKKAESLTPGPQRKQLKAQLDQIRAQAVKFKKQQAKAQKKAQKNAQQSTTPGGAPLQSPFGGAPSGP